MALPSRYSSSRANLRVSRSTHFMMPVLPAVVDPLAGLTGWPFNSQSNTAALALAVKNRVRPHFPATRKNRVRSTLFGFDARRLDDTRPAVPVLAQELGELGGRAADGVGPERFETFFAFGARDRFAQCVVQLVDDLGGRT